MQFLYVVYQNVDKETNQNNDFFQIKNIQFLLWRPNSVRGKVNIERWNFEGVDLNSLPCKPYQGKNVGKK